MTPAASHPSRIRCLIVDDVEENLVALEALLQRDDVDILRAASGREALELLLLHSDVALALLDVQMPEMNGFELAELIRGSERTRHVPLIFMTAGSHDRTWQFKGYETGAVDFLYKPIDPYVLATKADVFFSLQRQRRALAQQLHERTEALRMNEMFMAVLGHDLRNPLTAIQAAARVLERASAPSAEQVHVLAGKIASSSQRMGRMIEDLLDVTRVRQAGGLALQFAPVQLADIVENTLHELRTSHPERAMDLAIGGNSAGTWDAARLGQVVSNLLGNALHHGDPAVPVTVTLDGRAEGVVSLRVANGGTIPSHVLPRLFDPFRGRGSHGAGHQGLGLGLYIVRQIVLAHGGEIEVDSTVGRTEFRVVLPRHAAHLDSSGRISRF